jgi:hypothetical protein
VTVRALEGSDQKQKDPRVMPSERYEKSGVVWLYLIRKTKNEPGHPWHDVDESL